MKLILLSDRLPPVGEIVFLLDGIDIEEIAFGFRVDEEKWNIHTLVNFSGTESSRTGLTNEQIGREFGYWCSIPNILIKALFEMKWIKLSSSFPPIGKMVLFTHITEKEYIDIGTRVGEDQWNIRSPPDYEGTYLSTTGIPDRKVRSLFTHWCPIPDLEDQDELD